jgi:signal transduction histidine kinase
VIAHAEARRVRVAAWRQDDSAVLTVEDDGRGFEPGGVNGERRQHFGLRILHDLTADANGKLAVESAPGSGTSVRIEVPV